MPRDKDQNVNVVQQTSPKFESIEIVVRDVECVITHAMSGLSGAIEQPCVYPGSSGGRACDSGTSQGTLPSSMETLPSDMVDGEYSEEDDAEETWGRLFPLGSSFVAVG